MSICQVRNLGLMDYQQAWDLQSELAARIAVGDLPATLLLLEHPHTITYGRKGNPANLLWSERELAERGVRVYWVDRGGDITYHGPGQLVGYPLLRLDAHGLVPDPASGTGILPHADYTGYLHRLEQVIILALQQFGVNASRIPRLTGVWVGQSKIASIGVKVDAHGVTRHGFAINVAPDMSYWQAVIGCGLSGYDVTSMADLLPIPPAMQQVTQAVITAFEAVFAVECTQVT